MKRMLLVVSLMLIVGGAAHADFNVIISTGQPNWGCNNGGCDFDRGRRNDFDRPRFSVGFSQPCPQPMIGQTGLVNGILCQLVQTSFGLQWVPLQQPCNTGYNPNPAYNGFGGGNNDAYQRSYQQTLDQLRQEAFDRQQRDARQAGQRAAEQQFNGGSQWVPAAQYQQPQHYAPPAPTYYTPAPVYGGGYPGWNCPSAR